MVGITKIEIRKGSVGEREGWCFDVYWGDRAYPNFISALYKTRQETFWAAETYREAGRFETYGSAERE